jgi:Rps23 Pro-64 3,4-dihydroxylase Tpa1-like proline 4-hydroxylase
LFIAVKLETSMSDSVSTLVDRKTTYASTTGSAAEVLCYWPAIRSLKALALSLRQRFLDAIPFPHVVIDDFFPFSVLDRIVAEIPARDAPYWTQWGSGSRVEDSSTGVKQGISAEALLGLATRALMLQLNSGAFLHFLATLMGAEQDVLVGDPTFFGGGLHATGRGGRLLVHSDIERHPLGEPFCQRVNVIIYLNHDWRDEYEGHLELWSRDGSHCVQRILPVFNRLVVFESGTDTYHGHPIALKCPPDRHRYSIATYYYCVNRTRDEHYTGFQRKVLWLADGTD